MVVVWRKRRWLLYGEGGDGCCMVRVEMVVVWLEGEIVYLQRLSRCLWCRWRWLGVSTPCSDPTGTHASFSP